MANVLLEMDGGVAVVTLAKPPHNLIDDRMLGEIAGAYADAVSRGARAILLRSAMRHFCAGADLTQFTDRSIVVDRARWNGIMSALEDVYVPTVALHGIKLQANLAGRGGVDAADAQQVEINEMVWHSHDRRRGFEAFKATGVGTAVFAGD